MTSTQMQPGTARPGPTNDAGDGDAAEAFVGRLLEAVVASGDVIAIHLGGRLGYYQALAKGGALTATELAERTGTNTRYAREWLEQQATAGVLEASPTLDAAAHRFALPAAHAEVLLEADSLNYFAPITAMLVTAARQVDALAEAYRTGGGVPWAQYGTDIVEAQAALNRPAYLHLLGESWLPSMADIDRRLRSSPAARVADLGCGGAWSSIAIARAYPSVVVEAFDNDEASVALARKNVRAAGVEDRVTVHVKDAADPALRGRYDLITIFEALHDMARPVEVLRVARGMLAEGGSVLVVDERAADEYTPDADPIERFLYVASLLVCLPASMSEPGSAATGAVIRRSTLEGYARQAGFGEVVEADIDFPFWRFYQLRP